MEDFSKRIAALSPEQRALLDMKLKKRGLTATTLETIPRRKATDPCVLSVDQERLWFIEQMTPGNIAYNVNSAARYSGPMSVEVLERSINEIIRRHEALRTNFLSKDGKPVQVIRPERTLKVKVVNVPDLPGPEREAELERLIDESGRHPFDLAEDLLVLVTMIRMSDTDNVLSFSMHHLVTDWWSYDLFMRELEEFYAAFLKGKRPAVPELPIQYADFALWQRRWVQTEAMTAHLAYWKKQLSGAPLVLDLPTDRPRPPAQRFVGTRQDINFPRALSDGLRVVSQREGVSTFMTVLALIYILLYRYSGQDDIILGSPSANRERPETQPLIGYFLNLLMLRGDLSDNPSFQELLKRVREATVGAYAHQDLSFGRLLEELNPERDTSRNPVFQVVCAFLEDPDGSAEGQPQNPDPESITIVNVPVPDAGTSRFDMTFAIWNKAEGMSGYIEYSTDLFDAATMARLVKHLEMLAASIIENPTRRVQELAMLTEAEREQLVVEWNQTASDFPAHLCIHQLFQQQAALTPDLIAISFNELSITYSQLDRRTNQLARHLQSLGVGPEVRVAVCLPRGADLIVALLGTLKAGGAYVPLDATYPLDRLSYMLEDSGAPILITDEVMIDSLPAHWGQKVLIDEDREQIERQSEEATVSHVQPDNVCYVIYTSGTTGKPKGVSVAHRGVVRLVKAVDYVRLNQGEAMTQMAPVSFDASTFEIWGSLLNGMRLEVMSEQRPTVEEIGEAVRERGVSVMWLTSGLFNVMVEEGAGWFRGVKQLITGGDVMSVRHVEKAVKEVSGMEVRNAYGPTESTTFTSTYLMKGGEWERGSVPIGRPITNTEMYVMNEALELAGIGVRGELHIGGAGLARGYEGDAMKTAEKFIPDPFGKEGGRLYRTGDVVRQRGDGNVEFIGRNDEQVKIRGFRIELGEIENMLDKHPGVQQAVMKVDKTADGKRLVAYVVANQERGVTASELRKYLADKLPEYMVPSAFVLMERMPLTPVGKIDRRALPAVDQSRPDSPDGFVSPRTRFEDALAEIWSQVLGLEKIGIHDNFFDIGGDSIRTIQVVSKALGRGLRVSINQVFQFPTVHELARQVAPVDAAAVNRPVVESFGLISEEDREKLPEGIEDAYPLTRLQAGMVFHSEFSPEAALYHDVVSLHIKAALDLDVMRVVLEEVLDRHEILRCSFDLSSFSEPMQLVHEKVELPLTVRDVRHLTFEEQEEAFASMLGQGRAQHFEWASAPLLRFQISPRSEEDFQFIMIVHHAVIDGWSMSSLLTELFQHYLFLLGKEGGSPPSRPRLKFRDFVALEREAIESEECQRFWRDKLDGSSITLLPRWGELDLKNRVRRVHYQEVEISPEVSKGLRSLARSADVPLKSVLLAAHLRVLSLVSSRRDVMTGYASNGRPEEEDGERVVGLFVNTPPLRVQLPGGTWMDLARATFDAEREMLTYRRYPLPDLQRMRGGEVLYETSFNYIHFHVAEGISGLKDLEFLDLDGVAETNFTLLANFGIEPGDTQVQLDIQFDTTQLSMEQIEAITGYYAKTLEAMATDPFASYECYSLLSGRELHRLVVEWNQTNTPFPEDRSIHHLFEEQAEKTPNALAVASESGRLTYGELNTRANRLAHHLRGLGVGPDRVVGVLLEQSHDMAVGALAVLKAGGACAQLDARCPNQRLALMIDRAGMQVVVTQAGMLDRLQPRAAQMVLLDEDAETISRQGQHNPAGGASPDNLAYVLYTPGSTAGPDGVAISHRSLVNSTFWQVKNSAMTEGAKTLQYSSPGSDVSLQEMFSTWCSGGSLISINDEIKQDPERLWKWVNEEGIERAFLSYSTLQDLADVSEDRRGGPLKLREVITSAEQAQMTQPLLRMFEQAEGRRLINQYGLAEAGVVSAFELTWPVSDSTTLSLIGRPVANVKVYLLDEQKQVVPLGTPGELHVGGVPLARGYLNGPDVTAQKFIPNPYAEQEGERLYHTGDVARYLPDGNIELLGRFDSQVNVRGHRVDLSEVEATLALHAGVKEAAVMMKEEAGRNHMVAYVVANEEQRPATDDLRAYLAERLPDYMTPRMVVMLDQLPVTAGGNFDRSPLTAPERTGADTGRSYVPPRSAVEEVLAELWAKTLGVERIGVRDNFFDMGGHSLLATQMVSRVRETFQVKIPLRMVFESPTVEELAGAIAADPARKVKVEKIAQILMKLSRLSEDDAEALLSDKLKGREETQRR